MSVPFVLGWLNACLAHLMHDEMVERADDVEVDDARPVVVVNERDEVEAVARGG